VSPCTATISGFISAKSLEYPSIILAGKENKGLGYGIASIMQHLTEIAAEDDVAIFMDADNTHDINITKLFLEKIKDGADVVIASRFHPESGMEGFPLYRRFLSHAAARFFRIILHLKNVRDYTSGFRAYKVGALKDLTDSAKNITLPRGFECQVELLSRFAKSRRFAEVPLVYKYGAKKGASKMRLFRTIRKSVFLGLNLLVKRFK
jgi:dolichol-phosphate mannosyltransferase